MKPTNEKRSEIAKRLRNEAEGFRRLGEKHDHIWTTDLGNVPAIFQDIMYYAGLDGVVRADALFDRLADLVDPTCHVVTSSEGILGCDRCRTVMLTVRAKPSFCPNCGARVVSSDEASRD